MKLCFLIQSGNGRNRRKGSERRKTERKSEASRSTHRASNAPGLIHIFFRAVAARTSAVNNPPPLVASSTTKAARPPKPAPTVLPRKDVKKSLKGVVVKRKAKTIATPQLPESADEIVSKEPEGGSEPAAKKRKTSL